MNREKEADVFFIFAILIALVLFGGMFLFISPNFMTGFSVAENLNDFNFKGFLTGLVVSGSADELNFDGKLGCEEVGSVGFVKGVSGSAGDFSEGNYLKCSGSNFNFGEGDFSVSGWFKTSSDGRMAIFAKGDDYSYQDNDFGFYVHSGKLRFWISDGSKRFDFFGSSVVNDGKWHHFSLVADRDSSAKIYLDGSLDARQDISSIPGSLNNEDDFGIGRETGGGFAGNNFVGSLDEMKIYSRVLSEDEISELYNEFSGEEGDYVSGDFNQDGEVNGLDLPEFKSALADKEAWENSTGRDADKIGDFNNDGVFNSLDVAGFKEALALEEVGGNETNQTFQNETFNETNQTLNETNQTINQTSEDFLNESDTEEFSNESGNESCVAEWDCSSWGACKNGTQNRICYDSNKCFSDKNETQECCSLTRAYWSLGNENSSDNIGVKEGEMVNLVIKGVGCDGRTARINISETDGVFGDLQLNKTLLGVIENGSVILGWRAEYQDDWIGDPEYVFRAKVNPEIESGNVLNVKNQGETLVAGEGLIPLTIEEPSGVDRVNEVVTSGVPLPRNSVYSTDNLKLKDSNGVEVPCQFKVTSRWDGLVDDESKSIKWVLLDFQTSLNANEERVYYLEYGSSLEHSSYEEIVVNENSNEIEIDTGKAKFKLNKNNFNLFDSVKIGDKEFIDSSFRNGAVIVGNHSVAKYGGPTSYYSFKDWEVGDKFFLYDVYLGTIAGDSNDVSAGGDVIGIYPYNLNIGDTIIIEPGTAKEEIKEIVQKGAGIHDVACDGHTTCFRVDSAFEYDHYKEDNIAILKEANSQVYEIIDITGGGRYTVSPELPEQGADYIVKVDGDKRMIDYFSDVQEIEIEEQGPVKTVVNVRGSFKNSEGEYYGPDSWARGDSLEQEYPWINYNARIYFYKNSDYAKVEFTFENNGLHGIHTEDFGPSQPIIWDSLGLQTAINLNSQKSISADGVTERINSEKFRIFQDWEGKGYENGYLVSSADMPKFNIKKSGNLIVEGEKSAGWIDINDGEYGVAVGVKDFWENFPKALSVENNILNVELWPEDSFFSYSHPEGRTTFRDLYDVKGGRHKTHDVVYRFYDSEQNKNENIFISLEDPLFALAPKEWYADTNALGMVAPADLDHENEDVDESMSRYDALQRAHFDKSDDRSIPSIIENSRTHYGWHNYGDLGWASGYSSLHYDWPWSTLLHYIRTGERVFFDFGTRFARHRYDIDQYHSDFDKIGGNGHDYIRHVQFYEKGYHGQGKTPTVTHSWFSGLMLNYYLTGDKKAFETSLEFYDAAVAAFYDNHWSTIEDGPRCVGKMIRGEGWTILNLVNLYRLTGNQTYLDFALQIAHDDLIYTEKMQGMQGFYGSGGCSGDEAGGCGRCIDKSDSTTFGYSLEPLLHLHQETQDEEVAKLILRIADFYKDEFLQGGFVIKGGTYTSKGGTSSDISEDKYVPLGTIYVWNREGVSELDSYDYYVPDEPYSEEEIYPDFWIGEKDFIPKVYSLRDDFGYEVVKSSFPSDLFAYAYYLTRDPTYLNMARWSFRDATFYFNTGNPRSRTSDGSFDKGALTFLDSMFVGTHTKTHGYMARIGQIFLFNERAMQLAESCSSQGGEDCAESEYCEGDWIYASDSIRCCSGSCSSCVDDDNDGYYVNDECVYGLMKKDCDDSSGGENINPGADEFCNGIDDDCDGEIDEDVVDCEGVCLGGACVECVDNVDCDDENDCTDNVCTDNVCSFIADDENTCDDDYSCTKEHYCDSGECKAGVYSSEECQAGTSCEAAVCNPLADLIDEKGCSVSGYLPTGCNDLILSLEFSGDMEDTSGRDTEYLCNSERDWCASLTDDRNGKTESAYLFDGLDDRIDYDVDKEFMEGDISFCGWLKTPGSNYDKKQTIIAHGTDNCGACSKFVFYISEEGFPYLHFANGVGSSKIYSSVSVTDNEWHYVCFVADRDSYGKIYVDSQETASRDISDLQGDVSNGMSVSIGREQEGLTEGSGDPFSGHLDGLRLFKSALSLDEINSYKDYSCPEGLELSCGLTDVGACSLGVRTCSNEAWSSCVGAVYPDEEEICDNEGIDDDCDGFVDCADEDCEGEEVCFKNCLELTGTEICNEGEQWGCDGNWVDSLDSDKCCLGECEFVGGCRVDDDCDDSNECTSGVCNADFQCEFPPLDGVSCEDGIDCTLNDVCVEGVCEAGEASDSFCLENFDSCNSAVCNSLLGCVSFLPSGCRENQDLVLKASFDGDMSDSSGNNNEGSCSGSGCPQLTEDRDENTNSAYLFDGVDDRISFGSEEFNFGLKSFSSCAWFKTSSTEHQSIFAKGIDYSEQGVSWKLDIEARKGWELEKGVLRFKLTDGTGWKSIKDYDNIVNDNEWHHVCVILDRTNEEMIIYLDGSLVGGSSFSELSSLDNSESFTVGAEPDITNGGDYFDGSIDEVYVYNRVLYEDEIKNMAGVSGEVDECVPSDEICDNNEDDDCDNLFDCADEDCDGLAGNLDGKMCEYNVELSCDDEFDNDADGKPDGLDDDCETPFDLQLVDVNEDNYIGIKDLILVGLSFGSQSCNEQNNYCERKDINQDGVVNLLDMDLVNENFRRSLV